MIVREAVAQDTRPIVELFEQLGYAALPDDVERRLKAMLTSGAGQAFVAELDAAILGVVIVHVLSPLHVDRPWALLSALVVDERERSLGIGAALLAAAERYGLAHGCSQLELSSNVARARAHVFYERHGYVEKRRRFVKVLV